MTIQDKKLIVLNAIRDFKAAKTTGNKDKISFELNNLHNVYMMVAPSNIEGNEEIRQLILENQ